jgi:hypothetical protein
MFTHAVNYPCLPRRRSRSLFLPRCAQHVRSAGWTRELLRAGLALAALGAWAVLGVLIAG